MIKKYVKLSEAASLDQRFYRMWYMCDIRITELSCIFNKKRSKSFDTAALILRSFSTIWQGHPTHPAPLRASIHGAFSSL